MGERRKRERKATSDYFLTYIDGTKELIGRILDLTHDGAMMISDMPIPVQVTFPCRLVLPRMIGRRRYIIFDAECKWCRKNPRLGWYESGYRLVNVSPEDQSTIEELISDWSVKDRPESLMVSDDND